jgi:hypothetical protein
LNDAALEAIQKDPDTDLFAEIYGLLQRTFREIHDEKGRGYNASRAYQSLYRNGARESVRRAVLKPTTEGFGRVEEAGRLDLTYEWLVLNPRWRFSDEVREREWSRLDSLLGQRRFGNS